MVLQLKTPDDLQDLYLCIAVVKYTLSVSILVANGGILLAFLIQKWRTRRRRPKQRIHPSGCFVLNLLIADTLVSAVLLNSVQFKIWPENAVWLAKRHFLCLLRFALGFLAVCGSHNALLSVVIDRYLAIVHTMHYKDWMTRRNCATMLAASWLVPVTGWMYFIFFGNWRPNMPICSENTIMANFSLYFWLPLQIAILLAVIVIQICVHLELRRCSRSGTLSSDLIRSSTRKSARVMLISTVAFAMFYGSFDVAAMVFIFFPSPQSKLLYDLSSLGTSLTFLVNPCLYSFKTQSIRAPVTDLLANLREALNRWKTQSQSGSNKPYSVGSAFRTFGSNRNRSSMTLSTSVSVSIAGIPGI